MTYRLTLLVPMPLARLVALGFGAFAALGAQAAQFELIYTGTFDTTEALNLSSAATPTFFTGTTPFTIRSFFDTSTPNLAPPLPGPFSGFRAYSPSATTITVAGQTYTIESSLVNPTVGVTVAIFDQNSFTPGRYGIGLIADPVNDGAGIVGDFASASPSFSVAALTPTTFTDYYGVGHGSGVCLQGTGGDCTLNRVTPWVLHDSSNASFNLTLGNYDDDYPVAHTPGTPVGLLNTAQIIAVPEPATYGLMLAGLGGVLALARRQGQRAGQQAT